MLTLLLRNWKAYFTTQKPRSWFLNMNVNLFIIDLKIINVCQSGRQVTCSFLAFERCYTSVRSHCLTNESHTLQVHFMISQCTTNSALFCTLSFTISACKWIPWLLGGVRLTLSFCHLLITFANSLDSDQEPQNINLDLNHNYLTFEQCCWKNFLKKVDFEKVSRKNKAWEITQHAKSYGNVLEFVIMLYYCSLIYKE